MTAKNEISPSSWTFNPSDEELWRVRDAFVGYLAEHGRAPDLETLRVCISIGFKGDIAAISCFWNETLPSGMPNGKEYATPQVRELWRNYKIDYILARFGYALPVEWDRRSISACMRSADQLRRAADDLTRLEFEGFSLTGHELEADDLVFTWYLRRPRDTGRESAK